VNILKVLVLTVFQLAALIAFSGFGDLVGFFSHPHFKISLLTLESTRGNLVVI